MVRHDGSKGARQRRGPPDGEARGCMDAQSVNQRLVGTEVGPNGTT